MDNCIFIYVVVTKHARGAPWLLINLWRLEFIGKFGFFYVHLLENHSKGWIFCVHLLEKHSVFLAAVVAWWHMHAPCMIQYLHLRKTYFVGRGWNLTAPLRFLWQNLQNKITLGWVFLWNIFLSRINFIWSWNNCSALDYRCWCEFKETPWAMLT